jgi:hypothetical protein
MKHHISYLDKDTFLIQIGGIQQTQLSETSSSLEGRDKSRPAASLRERPEVPHVRIWPRQKRDNSPAASALPTPNSQAALAQVTRSAKFNISSDWKHIREST